MKILILAILLLQAGNSIKALPQSFSKKKYEKGLRELEKKYNKIFSEADSERRTTENATLGGILFIAEFIVLAVAVYLGLKFQYWWFILLVAYRVACHIWTMTKISPIVHGLDGNTLTSNVNFRYKRTAIIESILSFVYYISAIVLLLR